MLDYIHSNFTLTTKCSVLFPFSFLIGVIYIIVFSWLLTEFALTSLTSKTYVKTMFIFRNCLSIISYFSLVPLVQIWSFIFHFTRSFFLDFLFFIVLFLLLVGFVDIYLLSRFSVFVFICCCCCCLTQLCCTVWLCCNLYRGQIAVKKKKKKNL